ncbi:MAG: TonB-dependent receptor [Gammaproteobacteria bacterium]|nr:TonB-dependent receptor [Gammaproteobacteria bacterium]
MADKISSDASLPIASMPNDSVHFRRSALAAAIVAALGPTQVAIAQDDDQIEEILVTATKREMNLQDVPHSIDVLSALQLEKMGARDLEATLRAMPSITLTALQPGQNVLTMRGVTSEIFEYTRDAQVAVYLDEQPMTSNAQQVGIRNIDLERIEVLPGPQGTLFGSSSQTGTIRYITNKPRMDGVSGELSVSAATTSGGAESYDVSGVLNVPLVDDKLAARLVAYTSRDGGYVDNVFGTSLSGNYDNADLVEKDHNEYDVNGGRLHVLWNLSENWSTLFSVVAENTSAPGAWDSDAGLDDYEVTRFYEEFRDDDWTSVSATLSGDLGFADLSFTATRFDRDIVYEYDNMTYSQAKDYNYGYYCQNSGYYCGYVTDYYRSYIFNDQQQERDAFEIRLVSKGDTRFQWMVGAYYEDFLNEWIYGAATPGLVNTTAFPAAYAYAYYYGCANYYNNYMPNPNQVCPLPQTDIHYLNDFSNNIKQFAVYSELSYNLTDEFKVFGGIRWAEVDRDKIETNYFPVDRLLAFGDRASGDSTFRDVGKESDTIFKFGLQYDFDEDRMVYGLFSQGFRVGGANSQRAAATGRVPQTYAGDFVDNYEIGLKSKWADGRVTLNASAFYMEWTDYQDDASFGGDAPWWLDGTINAGGTETLGIEAHLQWRMTDNLTFATNMILADAEYQDNFCNDFVNGVNQGCVVDANGNAAYPDGSPPDIIAGMTMPSAPEAYISASLNLDVPDVFGGDMWVYYDFTYSSETWNDTQEIRDNNTAGLSPSWTYSNLSAGVYWPNQWEVLVNINNLFDQDGYNYIWRGEAGDAALFGDNRYQQQRAQWRPRTIWLTLRKGFGGR